MVFACVLRRVSEGDDEEIVLGFVYTVKLIKLLSI